MFPALGNGGYKVAHYGLRLRYATDAAFLERGWFADDVSVTADGATVFADDAETENGWTKTVASFTTTTGPGWRPACPPRCRTA